MMHKSRMLRTRESDVMEDYCALMIHIAPSMVPRREWDMVKEGRDNFSDIVTSTDEAHALLVIENNWNRFKFGEGLEGADLETCQATVWITEEEKSKYGIGEPRYTRTEGGRPRNGRQGKTGWSQDGLDRFNNLVELVRKGRADAGHAFDEAVKKKCRDMAEDNLRKRKRKRVRSPEEEEAFKTLEQFQVTCDFEFEEI